jgi:hypothetical protein
MTPSCSDPTVPSVRELAKALVVAVNLYKEQDAQARSSNVHFDECVQVELPQHCGNFLIDIELLGRACEIAKGRVGKLRVDAFQAPGEAFYKVFVREVASGNTLGQAVGEIGISVGIAVRPFSRREPPYVIRSLPHSSLLRWKTGTVRCRVLFAIWACCSRTFPASTVCSASRGKKRTATGS